ncbi:zinc ribbon domain-containing protein [Terrisporobacter mayombei]|uniref:zinc ribbon domain-containing protein n=1 Tax=Terrisporobacter mayombei TaxID=1541 RepID=UPI002FE6D9FA
MYLYHRQRRSFKIWFSGWKIIFCIIINLSKAISKQGFYEFKRQLEYKCKFRGIELIVADRFYPLSKTCSQCGEIKQVL